MMAKAPSPALLSILAVLAAANGSPPPSFLCPSLEKRQYILPPTITPPARHIPSKYVLCADGLWRQAESYSLYGSTFPCASPCLPTPSSTDDQPEVWSYLPSPTSRDDIRDSLPLGWKPVQKANERPALILALSLVLALVICFFIIGCVFWRKTVIKKRARDLEAKFKKQPPPSVAEVEKESKARHRILARATARWRVNLRHAPRQRKGKRVVASKPPQQQQHHSSHSLNSSQSRLALSLPSPSRAPSRTSSAVSLPDDLPPPATGESMSLSHDTVSIPEISPHTNVPISPPAYHHGSQTSSTIYSDVSHATSSDQPSSSFRAGIDPHSSTPRPFHAAHVATDDKALLARLADLASRPTDTLDACDTRVSAPAWHDELEDIPPDLVTSSDHPSYTTCPSSSLFPPPPSKERLAAEDLYKYPFSYEDMAALEPELEPSAPPFHLGSAPPLDDHQIVVPSAPPVDDTEMLVGVHPRAPQWNSTSCQFDGDEEHPTGQDHERITSVSGLPSSTNVLSTSRQDIGASDEIALPGYRP